MAEVADQASPEAETPKSLTFSTACVANVGYTNRAWLFRQSICKILVYPR